MRSMRSRKGERWGILTLQDMTGVLEILAFPESFARLEGVFKSNAPLVLKGASRGRGWDASRGDGRAAAGRHRAAASERHACSSEY